MRPTRGRYDEAGQKKHSTIIFKRRYLRDRSVKYEVTDKAPHKRSEDWARVVAVFVSGKEWQFKDWPFRGADDGDLVDTFQKIRGFYAMYDTEAGGLYKLNAVDP
jgi:parafibromin